MSVKALGIICLLALLPMAAVAQEFTTKDLALRLELIEAKKQAAFSQFQRGQEIAKGAEYGQLLMDAARRRLDEIAREEEEIRRQMETTVKETGGTQ